MTAAQRLSLSAVQQTSALLGEPVDEVAFVNRQGTLGAIVASAALDVATGGSGSVGVPYDEIRREGAKGVPLPHVFLIAVTRSQVHVFAVRIALGRLKVKQRLGTFDRAELRVAVHDTGATTVFRLYDPRQRQDMTFEILRSDYSHQVAAYLTAPAAPGHSGPTLGLGPPTETERRWRVVARVGMTVIVLAFLAGLAFTTWYFFSGEGPGG